MADDCKENQGGNDNQLNISARKVVKTPVCHVVDRGSIPRQKELLEPNTSFHKTTDSTFGVHIFRKIKTREKTERGSKRNEHQINISVSIMVLVRVCLTGDRGSIPRQRELLEPNTRFHQITVSIFDVSKINPEENVADDCKENQGGNDNQPNMSLSIEKVSQSVTQSTGVRFSDRENF